LEKLINGTTCVGILIYIHLHYSCIVCLSWAVNPWHCGSIDPHWR